MYGRFVDIRKLEQEEPNVIVGLPDVGLVGVISAYYLIRKMAMKEVAYFESPNLPPLTVVHDGLPFSPIRMFNWNNLVVLTSEVAVPSNLINEVVEALFKWVDEHRAKGIYCVTGISVPNRLDIDKPAVYAVTSNEEIKMKLNNVGIKPLEEGILVGVPGVLIRESAKRNMKSVVLLSETHEVYPDPGAAASSLEALSKLLGFEIDLKPLLEEAEEIRIRARDLMKRTLESMEAINKAQERDVPMLYYR